MKVRPVLLLVGIVSGLLLAGCENTVNGFGKDMQRAGEKIQKSDSTPKSSTTTQGS